MPQLQNFVQRGIVDPQPVSEASNFIDSSHNWRRASGHSLTDLYNLISPHAGLDYLSMGGCKTFNASYIHDYNLSGGSSPASYEA